MLEKLQNILHAAGVEAHETVRSAGLYYDGTQHGELFPCILVCNDYHKTGISGTDLDNMIAGYLRRARLADIYTIEHCGHQYYNIRRVMIRSDLDSAKHLDKVSDTFLNAFWQCLHDDPTARDNDAERARIAGRLAISALTSEEVPA